MRNLKLILSYDGSDFAGWQVQPDTVTVQGTLASAIGRITGEKVLPQGSGRTDAGVHALAQVVTFVTESSVPTGEFCEGAERCFAGVGAGSEVRRGRGRLSCAQVGAGEDLPLPDLSRRRSVHRFWPGMSGTIRYPLDEAAMVQAAGLVEGEHDFTSFAAVDPERSAGVAPTPRCRDVRGREGAPVSNVRRVFSSSWERQGDEFVYAVKGSGFLHHMVRNLVGTFILVGKGTLWSQRMSRGSLEARSRSAAGATAPASGLFW